MNKKEHILAQRYAIAYLNVYSKLLHMKDIAAFEKTSLFFKDKKQACFLFDLSLLDNQIKQKAFNKIIETCSLPSSCLSLFSLVMSDKRSILFSVIFYEIAEFYKKQLHIVTMNVESSIELSAQEKDNINVFLEKQINLKVSCFYKINEKLIAGIRMYNTKYAWECSVQAQLKALQNSERR